jgi:ATP-dependent helicase/nuclease subunit A
LNNKLPDKRARARIEQDLDINFMVEAGAGSGKTSCLVKRALAQIVSGRLKVHELAVITFTRKAAAELRERFENQLEELYRSEREETLRQRLEQALLNLDQCYIGTIHAFCARLLQERPVEAGLNPEFTEVDEMEEAIIQQQAWTIYLNEVKFNYPEKLEQLAAIGVSPDDLQGNFQTMNTYPDVEMVYEKIPKPDIKGALKHVMLLVQEAGKFIPKDEPEKGYDRLQRAILTALRYERYFDLNQDVHIVEILSLFERDPRVTLNRWLDKDIAKDYRDIVFPQLSQEIVAPVIHRWREYCHFYIMDFLLGAIKYYEDMRYEMSHLNYQDLLVKTAHMLKGYPEVRGYFQSKYSCLLIDEFQDTDPIQAEIMFYLTGTDVFEKDWTKLVPRPGSLFIVGDPKQSIYRFRRADIDTYNLVKEKIVQGGGEILHLVANFRSLPSLCSWFNPVFEELMGQHGSPYQAEYMPLEPARQEDGTDSGIRMISLPGQGSNEEEVAREDAECIAKIIRWALDGNIRLARTRDERNRGLSETPRPGDFMILLRYKKSMEIYGQTLGEYGIPVTMAGDSKIGDFYEIRELLKLLKALVDTENPVLLLGVLRGLFFGVSDDVLYRWKMAGGEFHLFSAIPADLAKEDREILENAVQCLKRYYEWTKEYPSIVAVERVIEDLGLIPLLLATETGKNACQCLIQVMEILRHRCISGALHFTNLVKQFQTILDSGLEMELSLEGMGEDAVRLMNLHKAKGLEAPIVFLAHPRKKSDPRVEQHVRREDSIPEGYFCFTHSIGAFSSKVVGQPLDWEFYEEQEKKFLKAEEMRLLYVAATRARNLLIISSTNDNRRNAWAYLLKGLDEQHVINIPDTPHIVAQEDDFTNLLDYSKEFAQGQMGWQRSLTAQSYHLASPASLGGEGISSTYTTTQEKGVNWGSAVHQVLKELVTGQKDMDFIIPLILNQYQVSPGKAENMRELIDNFIKSPLWERLNGAQQIFTEIPFTLKIHSMNPIYPLVRKKEDVPIILSGIIDLVFKEQDGWVVIDYKTGGAQVLSIADTRYEKQVLVYCRAWEQLIGERVKEGTLVHMSDTALHYIRVQ